MRKKIYLILACIFSVILTASFYFGNLESIYAEENIIPEYFVVKKSDGSVVKNNGTIFLNSAQSVTISLNENNDALISEISPQITLNGTLLTSTDINKMTNENGYSVTEFMDEENPEVGLDSYNFKFQIEGIKIFNNVRELTNGKLYGRFDIKLQYHEDIGGITNKEINYTFYLLKNDDYNFNRYQIENATFDASTISYQREYSYNYTTNQMPTLNYDGRYFDIDISKYSTRTSTTTTNITYRNGVLRVLGDTSSVFISNNNASIKLVFNDLAEYVITYSYIHQIGEITYPLYDNNATSLLKAYDKLTISGYALYHNDSTSNSGKVIEFKEQNSEGIISANRTDFTFLDNDYSASEMLREIKAYLTRNSVSLASTNQTAVQLMLTKQINIAESKKYIISNDITLGTSETLGEQIYFVTKGKILLEIISTDGTKQWFAFEITTENPSFVMNKCEVDGENITKGELLSGGDYTKGNVLIEYAKIPTVFDKPSTLTIKRYGFDRTTLAETITVNKGDRGVVNKNGYYTVQIGYGNIVYASSSFVIDNQEVTSYRIFNVEQTRGNRYAESSEVEFLTNMPISAYFTNKESGAVVGAEYKKYNINFINEDYLEYFNNENALLNFYNSINNFAIPVLAEIDYNENTTCIPFTKPTNTAYISSTNVQFDSGLYIFRFYDECGNESYKVVIIDDTKPVVLQQNQSGNFEPVKSLNSVSDDTRIYWGKYKLIKFDGDYLGITEDKFLNVVKNNYNSYFGRYNLAGSTDTYLKVPMENKVYYSIGGTNTSLYTEINNYGTEIKFLKDGKANEQSYYFYFRDLSNTQTGNSEVESFTKYYSNYYYLKVTSDASRTEVYYKSSQLDALNNQTINNTSLIMSDYNEITQDENNYSLKRQYFQPTNKYTLSYDEQINLSFIAEPVSDVIEVESIVCKFYPFERHTTTTGFVYVDYAVDPQIIDVYKVENGVVTTDLTTEVDGINVWNVNLVFNNKTEEYETQAGKYVIERKYRILSTTLQATDTSKDFIIRDLSFYVDRNSLISVPEVVNDETSAVQSVYGGAIKVKITNDYFQDLYIAQNYNSEFSSTHASNIHDGSVKVIFVTNKLPVSLKIPAFQYGYEHQSQENTFVSVGADYFDSENKHEITYNKLNCYVYKYSTEADIGSYTSKSTLVYPASAVTIKDNYLEINNITDAGFYEVVVYESDPKSPEYVFVFQIEYEKPSFSLTDTSNQDLGSKDNQVTCYTNEDVIRLKWSDQTAKIGSSTATVYKAKIDKDNITYTPVYQNGETGTTYRVPLTSIMTNELDSQSYYADINLSQVTNPTQVDYFLITTKYEGEESDFPVGYYKETKRVYIDKVAPKDNITRLLSTANLTLLTQEIRDVSNSKYNISTSEGDFRYFAFSVDRSELLTLIQKSLNSTETNNIWFRQITKYTDSAYQETEPNNFAPVGDFYNFDEVQIQQNMVGNNRYYEIVEQDLAGNLTIYTIYLTDEANYIQNYPFITWNSPIKGSQEISKQDFNENIVIYSKRGFNISKINLYPKDAGTIGYPWYYITLQNGDRYYHTPYLNDNEVVKDGEIFNLETITSLSVFADMQLMTIGNVPKIHSCQLSVGVLSVDNVLNFKHITESGITPNANGEYVFLNELAEEVFKINEGVIIEIPLLSTSASVYATNVVVKQNPSGELLNKSYNLDSQILNIEDFKIQDNTNMHIKSYVYGDMDKKYLIVGIVAPTQNQYYIYTVTDNFGEVYTKTSIYGAELAKENWISSVSIIHTIENNNNWYSSTKDISFEFNCEKDYFTFTKTGRTVSTSGLNISENFTEIKDNLSEIGVVLSKTSNNSKVYKVTMQANSEQNGGIIELIVQQFANITENTNIYTPKYVRIYNVQPVINLYGKNNENLNEILDNPQKIVGAPITIKFTNTNSNLYPNIIYLQKEGGQREVITSGHIVQDVGKYYLYIAYSNLFTQEEYEIKREFVVYDSAVDFFKVFVSATNEEKTTTGNVFTYLTTDGETKTIYYHYIVNDQYSISCNQAQQISARAGQVILNGSIRTTIYEISNKNAVHTGTNINYYETNIAITVIPQTETIINQFTNVTAEGTQNVLYDSARNASENKDSVTVIMEKTQNYEPVCKFSWNSYYLIKENTIDLVAKDENGNVLNPKITTIGLLKYAELDFSGYYYLEFKDQAGNIHFFGTSSSFAVTFLSSVIFNINSLAPINNAIYDEEVIISIPSSSLSLYADRAVPKINIYKNGTKINVSPNADRKSWTISESGTYKVSFSALVGTKSIREQEYTFSIINPNETRWAFEFNEYSSYYIKEIWQNEIDVTEALTKPTIGKLIYANDKYYLKNLLVSLYDEQTGAGNYKLIVFTNDSNNKEFEFEFKIKNIVPPVIISVEEGTTTTDEIKISFNALNLYAEVGDCVVKCNNFEDYIVNEKSLEDVTKPVMNYALTKAGTYYFQIYSESGKLLYSYKVIKIDPLNTISIIVIVVSCLVVVGLAVTFILVRKRMRIK